MGSISFGLFRKRWRRLSSALKKNKKRRIFPRGQSARGHRRSLDSPPRSEMGRSSFTPHKHHHIYAHSELVQVRAQTCKDGSACHVQMLLDCPSFPISQIAHLPCFLSMCLSLSQQTCKWRRQARDNSREELMRHNHHSLILKVRSVNYIVNNISFFFFSHTQMVKGRKLILNN